MSLQFNEYYHEKTGLTVGLKRLLFSEQSDFQLVEVYETDTWGNLLTIDGMVMLSEKDEFVYHEMLTHIGLFTHVRPERVLIIGGGDGGTAREVLKHPSVTHVDLVEIDQTVVKASREFLPNVGDFDNPKLQLYHKDGIEFVSRTDDTYDVILIDGSDPTGPAEGLFEAKFLHACHDALGAGGVLATQTESPWVEAYHPSMRQVNSALKKIFGNSHIYLSYIPLYPSGMWSMICASKADSPLDEQVLRRVEEGLDQIHDLQYYNKEIHRAAFALPGFVARIFS